ncbi:hypothetical protein EH165_04415 [Nakamurella antarctica]|uniref:Uncharacterized protein n=1 Tax=Nakamurella antarctica TaxID=1902245 RepID=A0A3G8ZL62_9ACTN|nr:hypothetical protein [Nakamurella antarctica]AZI57517.1 hypothetical protein EH165_04415 [Nakamurella antarctica]
MSGTRARELGARQQQLVDTYLGDLRRSMASKDPEEATEVMEAVREHIESALAEIESPTLAQVRGVLDDLGPVERIVDLSTDAPIELGWGRVLAPLSLVVLALLAVLLAGFWFLAVPLGLAAAITGLIQGRRSGGQVRVLYQIAAAIGAAAVLAAAAIGVLLVSGSSG